MDRIVETCSRLKQEGIRGFTWTIVGDGYEMTKIKNMSKEKNVTDIINIVGLKTNPFPYMQNADVFVLTSSFEGYGMTSREAQILGCPALITNFGPAHEVVDDGVTGMICDNSTDGVYSMMKKVLSDTSILDRLRNNLREHPITNEEALNQFKTACNL